MRQVLGFKFGVMQENGFHEPLGDVTQTAALVLSFASGALHTGVYIPPSTYHPRGRRFSRKMNKKMSVTVKGDGHLYI